jgi:hypothetical protein
MQKHWLRFEGLEYTLQNGNKWIAPVYDDIRVKLMIDELKAIYQREEKRVFTINNLPPGATDLIIEAIGLLEKATEWPGDCDDDPGEPPMTMDEMHTAAWREHQEMHS